jgi:hypothetical protein
MHRVRWILLITGLYIFHQDAWNWGAVTPLAFGFVPPGLWYHAVYTVVVAAALGWLVRDAWPEHLDDGGEKK